jgi:transketolase
LDDMCRANTEPCRGIFVLEDHAPVGGLGDHLLNHLAKQNLLVQRSFAKFAVEGYPACGTPAQVLRFHRLDGESLAERIRAGVGEKRP